MKKFNRKNKSSIIQDLTNAQKLVFAPLAFQALGTMLDVGLIELLDKKPLNKIEIINTLNLNEYTVSTLLQIGIINKIIQEKDSFYSLTKMGWLFLYDDMTKTNFNYIKDVCYLGANELTTSFLEQKPKGLHKFVGNYPTIYPALTSLPEKMKQSWYEFDHLYSDNCFEEVYSIISSKYKLIYDIGGNTGKFERLCLKYNKNIDITMFDLKVNIDKIKNDPELKNCKFHPINVLDKNPNYMDIKNGAVLMSQFLDCFSKQDIIKILTDMRQHMDRNSTLYILEPFTDIQKFEGAEFALVHTSLYFTCMANGISKFYTLKEMEKLLEKSGFTIITQHNDIGTYNYTLLECQKSTAMSRWFQINEQSAGKKRLRLSWLLYKIFGKKILYLISSLMSLFTFVFAPKIREFSKKYFSAVENHTGLKPNLINQFKHIHSYANSLVDKVLVLSGNFDETQIVFRDEEAKKNLFDDIEKGNGVFFICNHIGNIEVLQALLLSKLKHPDFHINILMSNKQSQIFNDFLRTIKLKFPVKIFAVENIGLDTGVNLKENLNNGEIVFVAGDRLAQDNDKKYIISKIFSHNVRFPRGTFKLAKLMDVPTYFISVIRVSDKYEVVLEKQNNIEEESLVNSYSKFMEQTIKINPYQFFHFYDFFD